MVANQEQEVPSSTRKGTMGTRGLPVREPAWAWWILFAGLTVISWLAWSWRGPLCVLALWCLYEFVLIPTRCNISPRDGYVCADPVRGRLFACTPSHQRLKTDQLFRLFRLANPVHKPVAPDPNRATGEIVWAPHMREQQEPAQTAPPAQAAPVAPSGQPTLGGQPAPKAPEKVRRILALADERMVLLTAVATVVVVVGMAYGLMA
jgi:hypothetical protein